MEYSIDRLCKMAGVTSRTLRHYHKVDLLEPLRVNSAGYRIYGPREVDRLQQILFFRALGFSLEEIKQTLDSPGFDPVRALEQHLGGLEERRRELDSLINTVKNTILHKKGEITMSDNEKFEGFKKQLIEENEEKYGEEIRRKYGNETVDQSNAKMMNMSQTEYDSMQKLGEEILQALEDAVKAGLSHTSESVQDIARMHRQWLGFSWSHYSIEAHRGLCQMYLDDARFTQYYDSNINGCARLLRDAVNEMAE